RDHHQNSLGAPTSVACFSTSPAGSCSGNTCTASVAGGHTVGGPYAGKTGTASIGVAAGPLDHLTLSPTSAAIAAGGSQAFTAEARDQYGNSLGDVTADAVFSISTDGSCIGGCCPAPAARNRTESAAA